MGNCLKTFNDLKFIDRSEFLQLDGEKVVAEQAIMEFENGYGVSVLFGSLYYSNGINSYELGVLYKGGLTYNAPITDDVLSYISADQVTEAMIAVQNL